MEEINDDCQEHNNDKRCDNTMMLKEAFATASDDKNQKTMMLEEAFATKSSNNGSATIVYHHHC